MAQLIKLRDYISRYEMNPFHYPTQFIRLKQENWQKLLHIWDEENDKDLFHDAEILNESENKKQTERFRWNPFSKKEETTPNHSVSNRDLPETRKQLTKYFLNQLYPFQLKWATSTLTHVSYTDQSYLYNNELKYFLQHFPDIYLVMYYPIFNIKKAPIDTEIIIISPIGIEIVSLVEEDPDATVIVNDERTWTVETEYDTKKILSPVIALKRTEQIINSILRMYDINFTVRKTILSKSTDFLFHTEPYKINLIGKKDYPLWYEDRRKLKASLKGVQLKAMEALLQHCLSTSVRRPEWEADEDQSLTAFSFEEE